MYVIIFVGIFVGGVFILKFKTTVLDLRSETSRALRVVTTFRVSVNCLTDVLRL